MITDRAKYNEYLTYEMKIYDITPRIMGRVKYIAKYFAGSEKATIWNWQKRLRKTEYYLNTGKTLRFNISKIIYNRKCNKYGLHIGLNVFDKGLQIMHLGSILTNGRVHVGEDCAIHINTALVSQGVNNGVPKVGKGVVIGTGAVVLGEISIADGIAVGANAVVNKTFEEQNIAIAGVPAKKISNNGRRNWDK